MDDTTKPPTEAEALRDLIAAKPEDAAKSFLDYCGAFAETADTTKTRPSNLLDLYLPDIREIYRDSVARAEHYDQRQHDCVSHLATQSVLETPITDTEKNELLLTFMRRTAEKVVAKVASKPEPEEIILEDGTEPTADVFEKQNYGDIVLA